MSNQLTDAEIERLVLIGEEAAEVVQAVAKILRHGWESTHPDFPDFNNRSHFIKELGDLRGAVQLCFQAGDIPQPSYQYHALDKLHRMQKYLHYKENVSLAQNALDAHNNPV